MSRSSRRISRPLIALLAIVIVLGVVFTVHKLKSARAAQARAKGDAAVAVSVPAQQQQSAAPHPAMQPLAKPTNVSSPVSSNASSTDLTEKQAEAGALVTQTPTEPGAPDAQAHAPQQAAMADAGNASGISDNSSIVHQPAAPVEPASGDSVGPPAVAPASGQAVLGSPLEQAKAKLESKDLIAARQVLNDGLISGRLTGAEADAAKKQIEDINQTLIFSARKFQDDPWGGTYQVVGGERLGTIAYKHALSWELLSRINGVTPRKLRSGQWIKIFKGPFHAIVYKSQFRMEIYLGAPGGPGSMYVRGFPVGLGKDNSTPTGLWMCKAGDKIRHPRYYPPRGGDVIAPDDPKNPLGGYWIALEGLDGQAVGKESYGIHGTIDPDSIGKQSSMGCIRLRADDISWVFDLLVDGKSKVLVKD